MERLSYFIKRTMKKITIAKILVLILALTSFPSTMFGQGTINVEIDYMVLGGTGGHSHKPSAAEINAIVQMFACHGWTLNVIVDDAITHYNVLKRDPSDGDKFFDYSGSADSFGNLKANNFDNTGGGWHYCIFGHQYQKSDFTTTTSSGIAELGGDDLLVSLGAFPDLSTPPNPIGTPFDRAATFAHELGHNLGLRHYGDQSGGDFTGDFQPNYASIMSYQFQLNGIRSQLICLGLADETSLFKEIDYSNGRLTRLNEAALNETLGVGISNVDWDCSGAIDGGFVDQDLDEFLPWCSTTGTDTVWLEDYNDWNNIIDNASLRLDEIPTETVECITLEEVATLRADRQPSVELQDPSKCPTTQPAVTQEACVSGLMIWVDSTYLGFQDGTGWRPYQMLKDAYNNAPDNSVLYLQPGTYTNFGEKLVLSKPMTLAGPGVVTINP